MPGYCELAAAVRCRSCGQEIESLGGVIKFQWGRVPSRGYRLGRRVKWIRDRNGQPLPPFTCTLRRTSFNCGDPQFANLIVFDSSAQWPDYRRTCDGCRHEYEGLAVFIEDGVLKAVHLFQRGEVARMTGLPWDGGNRDEADIIIRRADGSFQAMHDWRDHPITLLQSC